MPQRIEVTGLTLEEVQKLLKVRYGMIARCHCVNASGFERYGERGIAVCSEWRSSAIVFLKWSRDNGYRAGLQIDRKNSDGPYSPENCRWATPRQNATNSRKHRNSASQFKGVTKNCGRGKPWVATIYPLGRAIQIGTFPTEEAAARAYDRAALEHFGEFARLNFPLEAVGS